MRSRHLEGKKVDTQKQRNRELVTRIKERRKGKDRKTEKIVKT